MSWGSRALRLRSGGTGALGPWLLSTLALAAALLACRAEAGPARLEPGPAADAPQVAAAPAQAPARALRTPLERGLAAIDARLVAEDVGFLSADELEGRDTPSRGLRIAAGYIVNRLARCGLRPGAEDGWFHRWPLVERRLRASESTVALELGGERATLAFGTDWAVDPMELMDVERAAPLVWCGDGSREAFRGLELDGAIGVCLAGDESRARRRKRARDAGAGALLVLRTDLGDGEPSGGREGEDPFPAWVERLERAFYMQPRERPARTPVLWVQGRAAESLAVAGAALEPGAPLGGSAELAVVATRELAVDNVCGYWPGTHPELRSEFVLVSAHYDHVGIEDGEIYNGADDNASGSAALLALAEALAAHGPLERSVLLLWVSGEERGLLGSAAWARDLWLPDDGRAVCNINFDMVGRNAPGLLEYTPTETHAAYNGLSERVVRLAADEGFDDLRNADRDFGRSDHASFYSELGIPVVYVSAGEHPDYHQPTDTADKIDSDKVARFTRLVFRLILELQEEDLRLEEPEAR